MRCARTRALKSERRRRSRRRARRRQQGAAYDLFLTRTLKHATLVRAEESFDVFLRDGLEAVAGVKQAVVRFVEASPVARMLPGRFMEIQQAMCLPKGRDDRRRLSARLRRGDEGVGLRRRGDRAQRAGGDGRAAGGLAPSSFLGRTQYDRRRY